MPINSCPASKTLLSAPSRLLHSDVSFFLYTSLWPKEDNILTKYLLYTIIGLFFKIFTLKSKQWRW